MSWLFQSLAAEVGLRRVRLHDLRHGAASLALAAHVPVEIVSKRLGHSSIAITANLYQHLLPGVGKAAAEAAAALVPRSPVTTRDHQSERSWRLVRSDEVKPQVRAEGVGFEPTEQASCSTVFKTVAIGH